VLLDGMVCDRLTLSSTSSLTELIAEQVVISNQMYTLMVNHYSSSAGYH
jgi:hypothetical protein